MGAKGEVARTPVNAKTNLRDERSFKDLLLSKPIGVEKPVKQSNGNLNSGNRGNATRSLLKFHIPVEVTTWINHSLSDYVDNMVSKEGLPLAFCSVSLFGVPLQCWYDEFFLSTLRIDGGSRHGKETSFNVELCLPCTFQHGDGTNYLGPDPPNQSSLVPRSGSGSQLKYNVGLYAVDPSQAQLHDDLENLIIQDSLEMEHMPLIINQAFEIVLDSRDVFSQAENYSFPSEAGLEQNQVTPSHSRLGPSTNNKNSGDLFNVGYRKSIRR
ncbi:hypothetical protein V6N11_010442 [Hibiscus sabdariffa]|uniref:Uncharacterized protein n=1 Tax=Hibiscus sabdariffa TaxID=183260 RepID=A0ABR2S5A1_9ROSI